MSLNHLQLPDFIVAEWYKDTLLVPPAGSITLAPLPAAPQPAPVTVSSPPPAPPKTTPPAEPQSPPVAVTPRPAAPQPPSSPTQAAPPPASPAPPPSPRAAAPATSPATSQTPPNDAAPAPYKFLGNNRRHITLIVHSPGSGFLPDNQLAFLTKILEACRMTLADVAIVNHATTPVTIAALRQQLQPKTVLLFGLDPTTIRLPVNFPHFKQLSYDDCTYLSSPALDLLVPNTEDSKLLKSKLWVSLKTLFDV